MRLPIFDTYDTEGNYESATDRIGSFTTIYVHCYLKDSNGNATFMGAVPANEVRPDVNNQLGVGINHGFIAQIPTSLTGTYTVEVSAMNIGACLSPFIFCQ